MTCPICKNTELHTIRTTKDYLITQESFDIVQCNKCGIGITTPQPQPSELAKYYLSSQYISHAKKATSLFDRTYLLARTFTLRWKKRILNNLITQKKILDFGCGTAALLTYLKQKNWEVSGVEPSMSARQVAENSLSKNEMFASLHEVNDTFPVITLWHVLEHVPDLHNTIDNLKTKLQPNGHILIAVPNINSWDSTQYQNFWAALDTPRHLWHFTQNSIKLLMQSHGLKLVKIIPMKLDAYYVAMISEKSKHGKLGPIELINAINTAFTSNSKAKHTGESSSLIYIFKNDTN